MRPYAEARDMLRRRLDAGPHPMDHAPAAEVRAILDALGTLDREPWAIAFNAAAERHDEA